MVESAHAAIVPRTKGLSASGAHLFRDGRKVLHDPHDFGARLRKIRHARGLTLEEAALRAGMGRASLGHWETGAKRPTEASLGRLLDALEMSPRERTALLAEVSPERWTGLLSTTPLGTPVNVGQVIRAMRLRRGATQADLARSLGMAQATVAKWEGGDRIPDAAQLDAACWALRAEDAERAALSLSRHVAVDSEDPVLALMQIHGAPRALHEVQILGLAADWWHRAARDERHEGTYGMVIGRLAHHYLMDGRLGEANEWARRSLRLGRGTAMRRATVHAFYVRESLRSGGPPQGEGAVVRTRAWLEGMPDSAEGAWMLQILASALASVDEEQAALEAGKRAVGSAERAGEPLAANGPLIRAELHLALREPEKALVELATARDSYADEIRTVALLTLGETPPVDLLEGTHRLIGAQARGEAARRTARLNRAMAQGRRRQGNASA